jgi:hypothetical protein
MNSNLDFTMIGGFKSRVAGFCTRISALGFLGALGLIPGWQRLFGLTGFFGFLGVAYIVEAVHRLRLRQAEKARPDRL